MSGLSGDGRFASKLTANLRIDLKIFERMRVLTNTSFCIQCSAFCPLFFDRQTVFASPCVLHRALEYTMATRFAGVVSTLETNPPAWRRACERGASYNQRFDPVRSVPAILTASPESSASPMSLMAADMREVDGVIQRRLASEVALIDQISHYIIGAGGKRIRPLLVLLFSSALGFKGRERFELAATVEFIHTATLLHDDVVDESGLRRGRETANALFGNAASVLVGDFVYSRAFQMMVSLNRMRVLEVLADATNVIAEGEVLQLMNMHDPDLAVEDYLRVIRFKTAKLFEASARLGAVLAESDPAVEEACADYGRSLGTAFQLVDDLLDYEGSSSEMGKNVGDDLREGKPTLPLLLAMERGTAAERDLIRHAIEHGEVARLAEIVEIVRRTGAIGATRDAARLEAAKARASLNLLDASTYRDALLDLCERAVDRSS
jgi:octaprenyl-diphosphate synthase